MTQCKNSALKMSPRSECKKYIFGFCLGVVLLQSTATGFVIQPEESVNDLSQAESINSLTEAKNDLVGPYDVITAKQNSEGVKQIQSSNETIITDSKKDSITTSNINKSNVALPVAENVTLTESKNETTTEDNSNATILTLINEVMATMEEIHLPTETEPKTDTVTYSTTTQNRKSTEKNEDKEKKESEAKNATNVSEKIESSSIVTATVGSESSSSSSEIITTMAKRRELFQTEESVTTGHPWKKYTTIERARETTLSSESEPMAKADTVIPRISLENDFDVSAIPSLERLKNDLFSFTKALEKSTLQTSTPLETSSPIDTTQFETPTTTEINNKKGIVISSMRGGFLDLSAKQASTVNLGTIEPTTTPKLVETTNSISQASNIAFTTLGPTEIIARVVQITELTTNPPEVDMSTPIKPAVPESSSSIQRTGESVTEENTRQATVSNNAQTVSTLIEFGGADFDDNDAESVRVTKPEEDMLSVKPIVKNASLYTVNPNYKPLKKIEVVPTKAFTRNPDDNSWRNESISSLGIVFKPNNSSKPFTQVLKNKTETELSNLTEKTANIDDIPELKKKLEKIAEERKKKKIIDSFGNTMYVDYDSAEKSYYSSPQTVIYTQETQKDTTTTATSTLSPQTTTMIQSTTMLTQPTTNIATTYETKKPDLVTPLWTSPPLEQSSELPEVISQSQPTNKGPKESRPSNLYNIIDYYSADESAEVTLPRIDLKKFTVPLQTTVPPPSTPPSSRVYTPERKPSIQYFPPRTTQKISINDYSYRGTPPQKVTLPQSLRTTVPVSLVTPPPPRAQNQPIPFRPRPQHLEIPVSVVPLQLPDGKFILSQPVPLDNRYLSTPYQNDNRGYFVIKHYDLFDNNERNTPGRAVSILSPFTENVLKGVTLNDLIRRAKGDIDTKPSTDDYAYEEQFRKDILERFVDNFNHNSERFKSDFPIVYNNSIVHRKIAENEAAIAASSATLKRAHVGPVGRKIPSPSTEPPHDPHSHNFQLELSPSYEIHYYVPDEEEKLEVVPKENNNFGYKYLSK